VQTGFLIVGASLMPGRVVMTFFATEPKNRFSRKSRRDVHGASAYLPEGPARFGYGTDLTL
jgi:hypothetical protein